MSEAANAGAAVWGRIQVPNAVVISKLLAHELNLKTGDVVEIAGRDRRTAAVVTNIEDSQETEVNAPVGSSKIDTPKICPGTPQALAFKHKLGAISREPFIATCSSLSGFPKRHLFSLEEIMKQEEPILAVRYEVLAKDRDINDLLCDIQRIHPSYTSHGPDHSENIIQLAESLVSTAAGKKLTPFESYLLLSSARVHDIGMSDFEGVYGSAKTEDERSELSDKFRQDHALRARNYICTDSNWKRLAVEAYPIAALMGEVCKTHDRSVDISKVRKEWPSINGFENYGPTRLQLLCALLRLADALDLGHQRVKEILITTCHVEERYVESLAHLRGGMLISRVELKDNFIKVYATPKNETERSWVNMLVQDLVEDFRSVKSVLTDNENGICLDIEGVKIETITSSNVFSNSI
jgi:hypothetical protein